MNVYTPKYVSPAINPGVRTWYNVTPQRYPVDYDFLLGPNANLSELITSRTPPEQCDMLTGTCGYPHPYSPLVGGERIEGFGFQSINITQMIVIFVILYIVYHTLKN